MTGPLAQQFATLERCVSTVGHSYLVAGPCPGPCPRCEFDTALSVIERHVQDMEKALRGLLVRWPDGRCFCHVRGTEGGVDHMSGCEQARAALEGARLALDDEDTLDASAYIEQGLSALPAREEGTV